MWLLFVDVMLSGRDIMVICIIPPLWLLEKFPGFLHSFIGEHGYSLLHAEGYTQRDIRHTHPVSIAREEIVV